MEMLSPSVLPMSAIQLYGTSSKDTYSIQSLNAAVNFRGITRVQSSIPAKTWFFCCVEETVQQLFFNCCVAVDVWNIISQILDVQIGSDFEPVAKQQKSNKKHAMRNVCYADILWSLQKTRNTLCFQGEC